MFNKTRFEEKFASEIMALAVATLASNPQNEAKGQFYLLIGQLSIVMSPELFSPFFDKLLDLINSEFKENSDSLVPEIFDCLADICVQYKVKFMEKVDYAHILTKMFGCGFTKSHRKFISSLLAHFDNQTSEYVRIVMVVLSAISIIVTERKFKLEFTMSVLKQFARPHEGKKKELDKGENSKLMAEVRKTVRTMWSYYKSKPNKALTMVKECFKSLQDLTHPFFNKDILIFYKDCCLPFLERNDLEVKKLVISLLESSFVPDVSLSNDNQNIRCMTEILDKLLCHTTNEVDLSIQEQILSLLDHRFDKILVEKAFINKLVILLEICANSVKEKLIFILSRLLKYDYNKIIVFVKKNVLALFNRLELSLEESEKEDSIQLLDYYVKYLGPQVLEYIQLVFARLIQMLQETDNDSVTISILDILSTVISKKGTISEEHYRSILEICVSNLSDSNNATLQEMSLKTIFTILYDNKVERVYFDYPNLVNQVILILRSDSSKQSRLYSLKIFGYIGAMDPDKLEKLWSIEDIETNIINENYDVDEFNEEEEMMIQHKRRHVAQTPTNKKKINIRNFEQEFGLDICAYKAVEQLMRILKVNYSEEASIQVIAILGSLIKTLREDDSPVIDLILPTLIETIDNFEENYQMAIFDHILTIKRSFPDRFATYLEEIVQLIYKFMDQQEFHRVIFKLLRKMLEANLEEMSDFFPSLVKKLLSLLGRNKVPLKEQLTCFDLMRSKIQNYFSIIIPEVVKLLNSSENNIFTFESNQDSNKREILEFLRRLINFSGSEAYLPLVINNLIKHLELFSHKKDRVDIIFGCFLQMCRKNQDKFLMFLPTIMRICTNAEVDVSLFSSDLKNIIVENEEREELKLIKGNSDQRLALRKQSFSSSNQFETSREPSKTRKAQTNREKLVKEFDTVYCSIEEDWKQWFKSTSKALFEESPSFALYYCHNVSDYYTPILTELYNYAFVSCWKNLNDPNKYEVVNSLKNALNNGKTPDEILLIILNLAEFIEREDNQIEFIDFQKLGDVAFHCQAFAKALYYKENFYRNNNDNKTLDELISLFYELKLPEAAFGILKMAQKNNQIQAEDDWYIKLHNWEEGLSLFNQRLVENKKAEFYKGKCLCLDGLSDWESLLGMSDEILELEESNNKAQAAGLVAKAAFNLCEWEKLETVMESTEKMPCELQGEDFKYSSQFYNAVLAIKDNKLEEALKFVEQSRLLIDDQIRNLLGESYERAYKLLLENQFLFELEEIVMLKKGALDKEFLKKQWDSKFSIMSEEILSYEKILSYRHFIFSTTEDHNHHLDLAKICRKDDKFSAAMNVLGRLKRQLGEVDVNTEIKVQLEVQKCLWELGKREEALSNLNRMMSTKDENIADDLKSKLYCRSGIWKIQLNENLTVRNKDVIEDLKTATKLNEDNYKAWHFYGFGNYKIFASESGKTRVEYARNTLEGYTRSVTLGGSNISRTLQDLLQLIDVWFQVGNEPEVDRLINNSFETIQEETWLHVIPQLLARANTDQEAIKSSLLKLLKRMGRAHPRALVTQLVVMRDSNIERPQAVANEILEEIEINHPQLVFEAGLITTELNRCALLLLEEWIEAIEEGAKLYFRNNDINGVVKILMAAHKKMESAPETLNEINFYQSYMKNLQDAKKHLQNFIETGNEIEMKLAWDIYHPLFWVLKPNLNIDYLDLESVSDKLCNFTESEMNIPGMYKAGYPVIKIKSFNKRLQVMTSKQRPRRLSMMGSDDKEYNFLLKGHEDLRQDERVMQLFGLVNTLLGSDTDTGNKNLSIKRFSIIPLSNNTGLISWVANCDVLHALIKEHRSKNNIMHTVEFKLIQNEAARFDSLPFLNKLEIFKHTLQNTLGLDLYKVLWKKSKNSETWLDRRTLYSRSLAVMSIVGYILGLGDRHPSNIMLDRISGKIIHIDFGDCFEVAMKRDKFPEKVPFRLTRMLIKALEVSGIEGTFKITCENVMRVLRSHKDSLKALLSSFIDDPLISFRIMIPMLSKKKKIRKCVTKTFGGA